MKNVRYEKVYPISKGVIQPSKYPQPSIRTGGQKMSKDEFETYLNQEVARTSAKDPNERVAVLVGKYGTWLRREREVEFTLLYASFNRTRKGIN